MPVLRDASKEEALAKVVMFSTTTCSWCRRAKKYFRENRILFKEIKTESQRLPSSGEDEPLLYQQGGTFNGESLAPYPGQITSHKSTDAR